MRKKEEIIDNVTDQEPETEVYVSTEDTKVEEPIWDFPFEKAQVDAWKKEYGQYNVHLAVIEDDYYVFRGLSRLEYQELADNEYRSDEHMEDSYVHACLLYPVRSELELRNAPGGIVPSLFEALNDKSNIEGWRTRDIVKFPESPDDLDPFYIGLIGQEMQSGKLSEADIVGWHSNPRFTNRMYITEYEHQPIIYRGLTRSEYERLRTEQRKGKYQGPEAEEELCSSYIIYPFNFNTKGHDWLHGTISSMSVMIMRVSGFGATKQTITL